MVSAAPTSAQFLAAAREAQALLRPALPRTRMVAAPSLALRPGSEVWLKLECDLPTASFKPRGALVALHRRMSQSPVRGIVAASSGNHGAAVAWVAQRAGLPATIVLPLRPNPVKRARIAALGAAIVETGDDLAAAAAAASELAERKGLYLLNDVCDPGVPLGTATIACEMLEDRPGLEAIYVPMGDTALIRGVAAAAKAIAPGIRIVGVQPERAAAYCLSWQRGEAVSTPSCDTIADGLATRTPHAPNVAAIRTLVDAVCQVSEDEMLAAIRRLLLDEHIVSEPSGAAATAALLRDADAPRLSAAIVSGANLTPDLLRRAAMV